jgi:hypothetical protein
MENTPDDPLVVPFPLKILQVYAQDWPAGQTTTLPLPHTKEKTP